MLAAMLAAILAGLLAVWPASALGQATEPLRSFTIPSGSMEPNLQIGDVVLTRWTGRPGAPSLQRGDIVIFLRDGVYWVKRIIGLPGDIVEVRRGTPLVNGQALAQTSANGHGRGDGFSYFFETSGDRRYRIQRRAAGDAPGASRRYPKTTVPKDTLFVMGDNRDDSFDSRMFGPVPMADLRFVAVQVLFARDANRAGLRLDRNVAPHIGPDGAPAPARPAP